MIRALIFDMDGTLVDSEKLHYDAWEQTLLSNGVESFPFDSFIQYIGTTNEKLAGDYIISHKLNKDVSTLLLEKQNIYMELIPTVEPLPGVKEFVTKHHGRFQLAIASSSNKVELLKILETLQLSEYFEHVVGGDMVSRKKPDPEIYLQVMNLLGCSANECIAFEDSETGLAAAKNAGMFGIVIPNRMVANGDFSRADRVVKEMHQINGKMLEEFQIGG